MLAIGPILIHERGAGADDGGEAEEAGEEDDEAPHAQVVHRALERVAVRAEQRQLLASTTRHEPQTTTYIENMTESESEPKNQADSRQSVPSGTSRCTMLSNEKPTRIAHCVMRMVYRWMWKSSSSCRMPKACRLADASHTCLPVRSMFYFMVWLLLGFICESAARCRPSAPTAAEASIEDLF